MYPKVEFDSKWELTYRTRTYRLKLLKEKKRGIKSSICFLAANYYLTFPFVRFYMLSSLIVIFHFSLG